MPLSPFEPDVDQRPAGEHRQEPQHDAAGRPEMRASPRDDENPGAEEMMDEPGYGHGV